jgi:hypothetical protein
VSGERESSLADPYGGPAATDTYFFTFYNVNLTKEQFNLFILEIIAQDQLSFRPFCFWTCNMQHAAIFWLIEKIENKN